MGNLAISDLNDRLARGPRQVKAREGQVAGRQTALAEGQESTKQTKMASDKKLLDLKSGEMKIEDLKTKLNGCSSNKEYQALLEQISASEMAGSVLADEILETMEKIDQLEAHVGEVEKALELANNELIKCRDAVASESEVIRADIGRLEGELKAAIEGGRARLAGRPQGRVPASDPWQRRRWHGRGRWPGLSGLWFSDHAQYAERLITFQAHILQIVRLFAIH